MSHWNLSDKEFLEGLMELTIDPELFDNEAHFRFAWLCLEKWDYNEALEKVRSTIQRLDSTFGDGMKYHETITSALVQVIAFKMKTGKWKTAKAFIDDHGEFIISWLTLLKTHYSEKNLFSEEAKVHFVDADLDPLPVI